MNRIANLLAENCPNGVPRHTLGQLGTIYGGLSGKSKADFDRGTSAYIPYTNVFANRVVDLQDTGTVQVDEGERQTRVRAGDVLFTSSSENQLQVAMSSSVAEEPGQVLYLNSFCFGFRPSVPELLDSQFAGHLFRSRAMRDQLVKTASGVTRFNVSKEKVREVLVPLPPLQVQREISSILTRMEQLEKELETELEAELEARRRQYVSYRRLLLAFPHDVQWVTLPDVCKNLDRKRRPVTKAARISGPYPYYGASGVVDHVSDFIFDEELLLVSEDGANLLARSTPIAFSVSGRTWVNNHAHVLSFPSALSRRYVEIYLNSIDLSPYVTGGAQPKLNQANLNAIPIPWPSVERQTRVVTVLEALGALLTDLSSGLPGEIVARRKQYEYYRDRLLTFAEIAS